MKHKLLPPIWLLMITVGISQFSETVYTPSLPDIAHAFRVPDSWVEYTLTIYLLAFAIGTLFWGKVSDLKGRKPCFLMGLFIYVLGCLGCYYSSNIEALLMSRFIQAFGASTGSVLSQAICRDAFQGKERGRAFSIIGSAVAFTPAIGPIIGGVMDQAFGWTSVFILLMGVGALTFTLVGFKLPETHQPSADHKISLKSKMLILLKDPKVLAYGVIVGATNGIVFSYYAEGSFYLIDFLSLTPSQYGASFIAFSALGLTGGFWSRRMHGFMSSIAIMQRGIQILLLASTFFMVMSLALNAVKAPQAWWITLTLVSTMTMMLGISIILPNVLSVALENYQKAIGTASSLFGFYYYILISLVTLGMGWVHNDTLLPMPLYFCFLAWLVWGVFKKVILKTA